MLETHHPAFSCPLCRTFANLEDVEIDTPLFELEDDTAKKEALAPVTSPEDAEMLLLSPNMGRERDGAETEVEPDMGIGNSLQRIPVPPSIIDLDEGSDDDRVDAPNYDDELPLPPLPEGKGLWFLRVGDSHLSADKFPSGVAAPSGVATLTARSASKALHDATT